MINIVLLALGLSFNTSGVVTSSGPGLSCLNDRIGNIIPRNMMIVNNNWNNRGVHKPDFNSYNKLIFQGEVLDCGVEAIFIMGSSTGVGPAQMAIANSPDIWTGGYVVVSGAAGEQWDFQKFVEEVDTPVFQMVGELENEQLKFKMVTLQDSLIANDKEAYIKIYEGAKHGFLGSNGWAQKDLREFLQWTLLDDEKPDWWE